MRSRARCRQIRKRARRRAASAASFRRLGINSAAMLSQTGRIEVRGTLRLHRDEDGEHDFLGSLQLMADSACEPLERLIALEDAVARGIDETTARTALGIYR